MYQYVLRRISTLLDTQESVFSGTDEQNLLKKVKKDIEQFKHINFYHQNANTQLASALILLNEYSTSLLRLQNKLKENPAPTTATTEAITELGDILVLLAKRKTKLKNLSTTIPDGILDVKRALWLKGELSSVKGEDEELHRSLELLKNYLTDLNQKYVNLVKSGDSLPNLLWKTSCFYWEELAVYRLLLKGQSDFFDKYKSHLNDSGKLAARCLANALKNMPSTKAIDTALSKMRHKAVDKTNFVATLGFSDSTAVGCCTRLQRLGKNFFYLPHSNDKYHFDYNPNDDLVGTGGDCFGQSMMIISSLAQGKFKWLCPEAGLLNYQLDQSRPLPSPFTKETIASAETEVSDESEHDSLQWSDLQQVFSDEQMKAGDLCGLTFAMNSYTMSQRSFTAGHIAVVAKLDTERSSYKYIVFEKEYGVFGLVDDASLELVVKKIMDMYRGMSYSKAKLVKYGEATDNTYELISSIKPVNSQASSVAVKGLFKVTPPDEAVSSAAPPLVI